MPKGPKGQKRDPNVLGKLIVDISVGEVEVLRTRPLPSLAGRAGRRGQKRWRLTFFERCVTTRIKPPPAFSHC